MNFKFSIKLLTVVALSQMTLFCGDDGPVCVELLPKLRVSLGLCRSVSCPQSAKRSEVLSTEIAKLTLPIPIHGGASRDVSGDIYALESPESPSVKVARALGDALRDPGTPDDQIARYLAAARSMPSDDLVAYQKLRMKTDPMAYIKYLEQEISDIEIKIHSRCRRALDSVAFDYDSFSGNCEETVAHLHGLILASEVVPNCFNVAIERQHLIDVLVAASQEAYPYRLAANQKIQQLKDLRRLAPESPEEMIRRYVVQAMGSEDPRYLLLSLSAEIQEAVLAAIQRLQLAAAPLIFAKIAGEFGEIA